MGAGLRITVLVRSRAALSQGQRRRDVCSGVMQRLVRAVVGDAIGNLAVRCARLYLAMSGYVLEGGSSAQACRARLLCI